jgi:hypothetical protein
MTVKLTKDQVREIRRKYTGRYGSQSRLATEYNVSKNTIRRVLKGRHGLASIMEGERVDLTGLPLPCVNTFGIALSKHKDTPCEERNEH